MTVEKNLDSEAAFIFYHDGHVCLVRSVYRKSGHVCICMVPLLFDFPQFPRLKVSFFIPSWAILFYLLDYVALYKGLLKCGDRRKKVK